MGSSQSNIGSPDPSSSSSSSSFPFKEKNSNDDNTNVTTLTTTTNTSDEGIVEKKKNTGKTKKKKSKNSVDYQCRKQKRAWSRCVNDHYEKKFLPGKSLEPEQDCDDLFDNFRECYMKGMLKQRQEKGMAPPKKDTMLHEFMVEEGMDDTTNDE